MRVGRLRTGNEVRERRDKQTEGRRRDREF